MRFAIVVAAVLLGAGQVRGQVVCVNGQCYHGPIRGAIRGLLGVQPSAQVSYVMPQFAPPVFSAPQLGAVPFAGGCTGGNGGNGGMFAGPPALYENGRQVFNFGVPQGVPAGPMYTASFNGGVGAQDLAQIRQALLAIEQRLARLEQGR